ncbi:MAG TPA: nucleotidyltransferase domain-containing protein [Longimicrobium sp.]|nr:nucleotidyltransferase domain-containing protein [Longimicrobium sp.]
MTRIRDLLAPRDHAAALELVRRARSRVPAELVRALLFGSRARREARPDSDLDILLVWRALPPGREPQAGMAEALADEVAAETGVPVTAWSVSLADLACGARTPMLVDALDDGVVLWPEGAPPLRVPYTPRDAFFCAGALLERVAEGGEEVEAAADAGDWQGAAKRARDDLVRLCTAALLLRGVTRPRRGEAVRAFLAGGGGAFDGPVLRWAARSYGPDGKDDDAPVPPPPGGLDAAPEAVEALRAHVARGRARLARALGAGNPGGPRA